MERIQRTIGLAHPRRMNAEPDRAGLEEPADVEPARTSMNGHYVLRQAHLATIDHARLRARRIVLPGDGTPAASAYRMLRTQFIQRVRAHALRTIGIVSAVDSEGKTLTAANLALSLAAEPNQTVLLVDLDLRRPSLAALLGLPAEQGLEAYLAGHTPIDELFWRIEGIERLLILPTLAACAGSSELLAGARVKELLEELKTRYPDRLVLLDLPPVLLTDDVLMLTPLLDGIVAVAAEGRTRREDLGRMCELIGGKVRLVGTVLNNASESERRAY